MTSKMQASVYLYDVNYNAEFDDLTKISNFE